MPGIIGIIARDPKSRSPSAASEMVRSLAHETFYVSGTFEQPELGLSAGWINIAGSFSDCMPVWNEARDICLIFSGEEYGDKRAINELSTKGHQFEPGNASYLIHLYEELGDRFFETLNGLFSGLIIDLRQKRVVLFNDRYGINRIYFHENTSGFYFASEAKALLKLLPQLRALDLQSVGEFLSCGCVLQNRSLFKGIALLPGAARWTFSPGQPCSKKVYFHPSDWEAQPALPLEEYFQKVRSVWQKILPKYLNGKQPAALSLTAGLDSRLILAWARSAPRDLPCYTFGGMYRECVDLRVARRLAESCGYSHQTLNLDDSFLDHFSSLVEKSIYITDGVLDPTGAADLYLQGKARDVAAVRITGLYGGEILRRLRVFKPGFSASSLASPELEEHLKNADTNFATETQVHPLSFIAFKQAPWFIYSRLAIERSQLTLRTPYFDNELVKAAYQLPSEAGETKAFGLRLIAEGNPALAAIATDRGVSGRSLPGANALRGIQQEFTSRAEYAYDQEMPHWLARADNLLRPLRLERLFLGRHKISHFRVWYRDKLSTYLKDILLDRRTRNRPFFRGGRAEEMLNLHLAGQGNYTAEIHRMLTLELMQRQLIDS